MQRYATLTVRPSVTARLVAGALEAEGFEVRLSRPGLGVVYGLDAGPFATSVLVAAEELERARAVLAAIETEP